MKFNKDLKLKKTFLFCLGQEPFSNSLYIHVFILQKWTVVFIWIVSLRLIFLLSPLLQAYPYIYCWSSLTTIGFRTISMPFNQQSIQHNILIIKSMYFLKHCIKSKKITDLINFCLLRVGRDLKDISFSPYTTTYHKSSVTKTNLLYMCEVDKWLFTADLSMILLLHCFTN